MDTSSDISEHVPQNTSTDLSALIEAVLFWKAEPLSTSDIAKALEVDISEISKALEALRRRLKGGVVLQTIHDTHTLVTAPEASIVLERLTKADFKKDLGKAALETLAIILYKGPSTRADIDYIRGVSSQFIVRTLLMRGLIEKTPHPNDSRSFLYKPTTDLLSYLGITSLEELPEYTAFTQQLSAVIEKTLDEDEPSGENALTDDSFDTDNSDPLPA